MEYQCAVWSAVEWPTDLQIAMTRSLTMPHDRTMSH